MNVRRIIRQAIKACITDTDIENAITNIVTEELDIEELLSNSDTLRGLVTEEAEEAIKEELEAY